MNNAMGVGFFERLIYLTVLPVMMKLVEKGYMTTDMAIYVAVTCQGMPSMAWTWWVNRPSALLADAKSANTPSAMLTAAAETVPKNTELQIVTTPAASRAEKVEVQAIAEAASEKVTAKIAA